MARFKVLSLCGGGTKGVYTLGVLKNIVNFNFDLIVGTSTDGIIALGLGLEKDIDSMYAMYIGVSPLIFKKTFGYKIKSLFGLNFGQYPQEGLKNALVSFFGDLKLKDLKKRVIVTARETTKGYNAIIDSGDEKWSEMFVWEAALATCSAPTYFPSYFNGTENYIDGGVYAATPSLVGFIEGLKNQKPIYLLEIGTTYSIFRANTKKWGIKEWMIREGENPLSSVMMDAFKEEIRYFMNLFKNVLPHWLDYDLVDRELTGYKMDDTNSENLTRLYEIGRSEDVKNINLKL